MESHNGTSNGINGTNGVTEVEEVTTLEVKSIESISAKTDKVQPAIIETESAPNADIQPVVVEEAESVAVVAPQVEETTPEIVAVPQVEQPSIETVAAPQVEQSSTETAAAPQVEEIATLPVEVTVQPSVVEIPATEINGRAAVDASLPDNLEEFPTVAVAENVSASPSRVDVPVTKLPGNQPGSEDYQVPLYAILAVNRIAKEEGFTDYVIDYDRGSKFGDGFVAEIVRAKINGSQLVKGIQKEDSQLVLVLKLPPENKTRREQMGMTIFEREVTVYNEVLPMFQKFQLDKGLKPGQGFISFPKCYYAYFDKEKDEALIIMEDIRPKGYKMLNKYKTVDYPHAQAILETIAQLHGISLAMKDQCPAVFAKFKGLKDAMAEGMVSDMMKTMTKSSCEKAIEALGPHEENIKQKLSAFGENIVDIVKTCTDGELSEPYTVINHGDCWINNIMFKYERGIPRHLCLLDWQITRYASPVLDICYFLYQCTDTTLRAQHFDNLIQGYHIALRKQVELLGSDVNQILPFTALLREMKSKARFALSTALFVIPMLCTPNEELPNLDEMVETLVKGEVSEDGGMFGMTTNTESAYKQRMGGIVRDMYKKGYL